MKARAEHHLRTVSEGDGSADRTQRVLAGAADPGRHCGAQSKRTGLPCRQPRGFRTDHPGAGHCWLHGGRTPHGAQYARREAAERTLDRLGVPRQTQPEQALLEVVWEAAGNVAFLRAQCSALGVNVVGDVNAIAQREGVVLKIGEDVLPIVRLYGEWTDRLAKYAKAAVDAGLAKRQVELAEQTADAIVGIITAVFDELGLDEAQRERGRVIAGTRLRLLASGAVA